MFGVDTHTKRTLQKSQWMREKEFKKKQCTHKIIYVYRIQKKKKLPAARIFFLLCECIFEFLLNWIEIVCERWSSVYIFICKSYSNVCRHIDNVDSNEKRRSNGLVSANEMRIWGERTFRSNEIEWNKWSRFFYSFLLVPVATARKESEKKTNSSCCNMLVCNNTEFNWIPELWYAESACNRMKMR